jgi:hypothetical protein
MSRGSQNAGAFLSGTAHPIAPPQASVEMEGCADREG